MRQVLKDYATVALCCGLGVTLGWLTGWLWTVI